MELRETPRAVGQGIASQGLSHSLGAPRTSVGTRPHWDVKAWWGSGSSTVKEPSIRHSLMTGGQVDGDKARPGPVEKLTRVSVQDQMKGEHDQAQAGL